MSWIWVGCAVLIAYSIEAMTGFGSIVIALSLSALLFDIQSLVPVMVVLNILMTGPLVVLHRAHIRWRLLFTIILPFILTGTLAGIALTPFIAAGWAKLLFSVLIIWFAWRAIRQKQPPQLASAQRNALTTLAGITHGLFASGGPLLVYAMARAGLDKAGFRATMLTVWLTLNTGMTLWFFIEGALGSYTEQILWLTPCVIAGALAGNALHHRINEATFIRVIFRLLLLVGSLLFIQSLSHLIT